LADPNHNSIQIAIDSDMGSGGTQEWGIFSWGYSSGVCGTEVPSKVQWRSLGRGSGRWSNLQTLFTDFDCKNDQIL